jgi:hypothetical protein
MTTMAAIQMGAMPTQYAVDWSTLALINAGLAQGKGPERLGVAGGIPVSGAARDTPDRPARSGEAAMTLFETVGELADLICSWRVYLCVIPASSSPVACTTLGRMPSGCGY